MLSINDTQDPQLDEAVWQAWVKNNAAMDKFRFARHMKVIGVLALLLAVGALLYRFTG